MGRSQPPEIVYISCNINYMETNPASSSIRFPGPLVYPPTGITRARSEKGTPNVQVKTAERKHSRPRPAPPQSKNHTRGSQGNRDFIGQSAKFATKNTGWVPRGASSKPHREPRLDGSCAPGTRRSRVGASQTTKIRQGPEETGGFIGKSANGAHKQRQQGPKKANARNPCANRGGRLVCSRNPADSRRCLSNNKNTTGSRGNCKVYWRILKFRPQKQRRGPKIPTRYSTRGRLS